MSSTLLSLFSQVSDPRRDQGKMYPLGPIPAVHGAGDVGGSPVVSAGPRLHSDSPVPVERKLRLVVAPRPAYSSVRFILQGLDADEMERAFRPPCRSVWPSQKARQSTTPLAVAIDGKTPARQLRRLQRPQGGARPERLCRRPADHPRPPRPSPRRATRSLLPRR